MPPRASAALAALALLAAAAACAAKPSPQAEAPQPPLVRAALAEWTAWGRVTVEGWPDTRPADTAATPDRFARLLGYWAEVPGSGGVASGLRRLREGIVETLADQGSAEPGDDGAPPLATGNPGPEDIALYAYPAWSAAFISAVARRAGLPRESLPSAPTHARYMDALLARAAVDPEGAAFLPHAPDEYAPKPGDLICADRAASPLPHWTARLAEAGAFRPMHCDVVVRGGARTVEAVGGNVQDMVVLRRFPADGAGKVLPPPFDKPPFVVVFEARTPANTTVAAAR